MSGVPYTFASATSSIPLSQLDANFATPVTIGTTTVGLGNTTTTLAGLSNVSTTVTNTSNVASNGSLLLQTNGTTTAVTIDTSQNVGIGSTSPYNPGGSYQRSVEISGNSTYATLYWTVSSRALIGAVGVQNSDNTFGVGTNTNHPLLFNTNGTERARIDSSGNLLVGTTSQASTARFTVKSANTGYGGIGIIKSDSTDYWTQNIDTAVGYTWGKNGADFWYAGRSGSANCVSVNGSWVNSSDSRLKTNVVTLTNALENICKLRGVSFNRIANNVSEIGLIAQEVLEVYPNAVEKPTTDESFYGLNYGSLVGPLVEAIKELSAQVTTLQSQVAALQAKVGA